MAGTNRSRAKHLANFIYTNLPNITYFQALRLLTRMQNCGEIKYVEIDPCINLVYQESDLQMADAASGVLTTPLMSLLGYNSSLPFNYTANLIKHSTYYHEPALHDFIKIFHKYIHNLYLQTLNTQKIFFSTVEQSSSTFVNLLSSLTGMLDMASHDNPLSNNKLLFFASLLGRKQKSLLGLQLLIKGVKPELHFKCSACNPYKIEIPLEYRVTIGKSSLGKKSLLGINRYKVGGMLELTLYDLSLSQWQSILHSAAEWKTFFSILRIYLGCSQACAVVIYLACGSASSTVLGKNSALGVNSWFISKKNQLRPVLPKTIMLPMLDAQCK